jgi:Tfp pilus assembly protein PilF
MIKDDAWQTGREIGKIFMNERKEFCSIMDHNTKNLLLSELYCASSYLERLLFAISQFSHLAHASEYRRHEQEAKFRLQHFIESRVLKEQFGQQMSHPDGEKQLEDLNLKSTQLLESILNFNFSSQTTSRVLVEYINMIYEICYTFHLQALQIGDLQIQLPRMNLIEMEIPEEQEQYLEGLENRGEKSKGFQFSEYDHFGDQDFSNYPSEIDEDDDLIDPIEDIDFVPKFSLSLEDVINACHSEDASVTSIQWRREKKYKEMLKKGHEAIFKKDHQKGLEAFVRAINYQETAEALTLIAWAHSLTGNITEAKTYCLKAIRKDGSYGPPYNDLGSYLLNEGNIEESLKWFELAKKCPNYQNREYPYINAGRAYMSARKYEKALEEFSKALALAPYHEELHQTVEKLKKSLRPQVTSPNGEKHPDLQN